MHSELAIALTGSADGSVICHDAHSAAQVRSLVHPERRPVHAVAVSGQGEVVFYSAEDRVLHLRSINGDPLAVLPLRYSRLRSLRATQQSGPGVVLVVEDSQARLLRAHDLSPCASLPDVGGVVSCATLREVGDAALEVVMGMENGHVITWSVDLREHAVAP